MIIKLDSMRPSGDGTPMLYKAGNQTTYIYPCFSRDVRKDFKERDGKKQYDEDQPYLSLTGDASNDPQEILMREMKVG